jgi:hypothetical protein
MSALDVLPAQYDSSMTCPDTGLVIPKLPRENLEWRRDIRRAANKDHGLRRTLKQACSSSPIFWVNAFGWTFHQFNIRKDGRQASVKGTDAHVPFITWACQDNVIGQLRHCIDEGENVLIDKSRDMGASWLCLTVFHWYWQFIPGTTFLEMSRTEKYVDVRGNMDTLFEKHRYLHRMQPVWLRPEMDDNLLRLRNERNGNLLVGESTNQHAGQGARKTAVLLDEFARVREAEEIDLALSDTTPCKIYNSTPQGPDTWFSRLKHSRACRIIELPWFAHPDKSNGAELVDLDGTDIGYSCVPGKKWSSPWYRHQQDTRSRRDLAANVDMNHGQAGRTFFDAGEIEQHRRSFQRPPHIVGRLIYTLGDQRSDSRLKILKHEDADEIRFVRGGEDRPWSFWCELINNRPDQHHAYTVGVDISAGTGTSNSVITVFDVSTSRVVAKFTSATTSPYDLAEEAVKVGIWFGGTTQVAVMNWETNGGVGAQFTTRITQIGYRVIWCRRDPTKFGKPKTNKRGWHSTPDGKEDLLGLYANGLKTLEIICPDRETLDEALGYTYDDAWRLVAGTAGIDEASGASATHGDRVVSEALAFIAREDATTKAAPPLVAPKHSMMYHRKRHRARQSRNNPWT